VSLLLIYTKLVAGNVDQEADDETAARTVWRTRSGSEGKQEDPVPSSQPSCCVGNDAHAFVCTPFAFLSLCIWNARLAPLWRRLRKSRTVGRSFVVFCVFASSGAISSWIWQTWKEFSGRSGKHSLSFVQNRLRLGGKKNTCTKLH